MERYCDHNQSNVPIMKCLSLTDSNMLQGQSFETGPMTQATPFPATSMIRSQIHYILSLFAKFKVTIGLSHSQVVEESQIRLQQNYRQSTTALQS